MRVFAYEMVTAGGLPFRGPGLPGEADAGSLLGEGRAMIEALATDLATCKGIGVDLLWDARLPPPQLRNVRIQLQRVKPGADELVHFDRLARETDATIVVAPETGGLLTDRCRRVLAAGGRLLGPSVELIEIASDKQRTAEQLAAAGVPVPAGISLAAGEALPVGFFYPAVLKPRDGAGSQATHLIADATSAARLGIVAGAARLERFCPGRAASVAVLCGPRASLTLPACWQHLSTDGRFTYLGGSTIDDDVLRARAARLAIEVINALPEPRGYLGIDLVLGHDPCGADDRAIEVNPRLTTSYVGLRRAVRGNLAQAWLDIVAGRVLSLSVDFEAVEFDATGHVWKSSQRSPADSR